MRGYVDQGMLKSGAEIKERLAGPEQMEYKASLSIAGHGTYQGDWHLNRGQAEFELNNLIGQHLPNGMESAGIPAFVPATAPLIPKFKHEYPQTRGNIEPDPSLHEPAEVRRQLGHHFNDPGY